MSWTFSPEDQRGLLDRVRAGHADAEAALMRLFWERVRLMMRMRTGDAETARDLAQDVMLALWQAIRRGEVRDPERLAAFVHGIARNVANNYLRRRGRQPRLEPLPDDLETIIVAADAADAVEDAQRHTAVQGALADLPPVDRRILFLTLVDDLKPGEIATLVGVSAENVRTRKSRALKKVTERLRGLSRNDPDDH